VPGEETVNHLNVGILVEGLCQPILAKALSHDLHHLKGALEGLRRLAGAARFGIEMAEGEFDFPPLNGVSE
jgi:hypothetical protein